MYGVSSAGPQQAVSFRYDALFLFRRLHGKHRLPQNHGSGFRGKAGLFGLCRHEADSRPLEFFVQPTDDIAIPIDSNVRPWMRVQQKTGS